MKQRETFETLEVLFPELSPKQLEISTLYALGTPHDTIAKTCNVSTETVRTYLKRSIKALNLEGHDGLRTTILLRSFIHAINK